MSPTHPKASKTSLRNTRRTVQVLFLAFWLFLFALTRYPIAQSFPPDLFLMTDPLVALLTMGAAQILVPTMLFALILIAFGLVFGRAFCGWICPLGTLIDFMAKIFRPPTNRWSASTHQKMLRWKYYILAFMTFAALLSFQWIFFLDPLVLLYRGVSAGIYPMLTWMLPDQALPESLRMTHSLVALLPFLLFLTVLLLTAITPRFFCRYLCPLGAFYGLLARAPWLRRRVKGCDACKTQTASKQCITLCRMGAIPSNPHRTRNHECIRCFSDRAHCQVRAVSFQWMLPKIQKPDDALLLDRRQFLIVGAGGLALAPLASLSAYHGKDPNWVIRPPRVLEDNVFMDQCVRCGMCIQACPTQTLQFTHLESGFAGLWTPAITPRIHGCIPDCNACSLACPTGAIPEFGKPNREKWVVKMGTAELETGRCISYTEGKPCKKCIDICPTLAILADPGNPEDPKHPPRPLSIDYVRCVGCGLCEYACRKIVFGKPAVVTYSHGRGQPAVFPEKTNHP